MIIKILGIGCANCKNLEKLAREVAVSTGLSPTFEKVTDLPSIMGYGVMSTPALVINDEVMSTGRVPSRGEITGWLQKAAATQA